MPTPPSFVPRDLLIWPGYFGRHADAEYYLARDLPAMQLAWAREQHELALAVEERLNQCQNSIADLAAGTGQGARMLGEKVSGKCPAINTELILWCWLTGKTRLSCKVELLEDPDVPVRVPSFPFVRGRGN